jgi:tight adherence protein B
MNQYQAIGLFGAIALFCVLQALFWITRMRHRRRDEILLQQMRAAEYGADDVDPLRQGGDRGWAASLKIMQRVSGALAQAGIDMPVERFVLYNGMVVLFAVVLVTLATEEVTSGVVFGLVLMVGIYVYFSGRRKRRLSAIDEQLPQALELMIFGLRAGHTLEESIHFVAHEIPDPLASELRRCYEEYEMGRPITTALVHLSRRLAPCRALRTFVESVLVLKQTGGNMVEIMEQIIETLREQAAYEARYRALTAEGRTSGMILGSLPLLILAFVMLLQPGYIGSLFYDPGGRMILLFAVCLWGVGVAWLIRLVRPAL